MVLTPSLSAQLDKGQAGLGAGTQVSVATGHPAYTLTQLPGLPHSLAHLSPSPLGPLGLPESSSVEETIFLVPMSS